MIMQVFVIWPLSFICFLLLIKTGSAEPASNGFLYCPDATSFQTVIEWCNAPLTMNYNPRAGYIGYIGGATSVVTSQWAETTASVEINISTFTTTIRSVFVATCTTNAATMDFCRSTLEEKIYSDTYYTFYEPTEVGVTTTTLVDTVTVTQDIDTCSAVSTDVFTKTVSYSIGSGGQLTIYTSGPTVGTATSVTCSS